MPLPIAGIMSDQNGEWVREKLEEIHKVAYEEMGIQRGVEPVMTLCFMSLAVLPEIKLDSVYTSVQSSDFGHFFATLRCQNSHSIKECIVFPPCLTKKCLKIVQIQLA